MRNKICLQHEPLIPGCAGLTVLEVLVSLFGLFLTGLCATGIWFRESTWESPSPLARLEREAPVKLGQVNLRGVQINGQQPSDTLLTIQSGEKLVITGKILAGELGIGNMNLSWSVPPGKGSVVEKKLGSTHPMLVPMLLVHEEPFNPDHAGKWIQIVNVRPIKGVPDQLEFLGEVSTPERRGTYVADIALLNMSEPAPESTPETPLQFPIFRLPFRID